MRHPPSRSCRPAALLAVVGAVCLAAPAHAQRYDITRYSTAAGLPAARVEAVMQDQDGYLWVGTSAGLARYDGAEFRVVGRAEGLAGASVVGLAVDPVRGLLTATRDGGLSIVRGLTATPLGGEGLATAVPRGVTRDGQGTIWVATSEGVVRIDPGAAPVAIDGRGVEGCCRTAYRDHRGRIWAGTDSGLAREQGGRLVPTDLGVPGDARVTALVEDAAGALWVGTGEGLYRERSGRFVRVPTPLGDRVAVRSAAIGPGGTLWFGTERGAVRASGGIDGVVTSRNGLPDDQINGVFVDREGTTWFATDSGVAKLVPSRFSSFDASHGLADDFVVGVVVDAHGTPWVATRRGLTVLPPDAPPRPVPLETLGDASITCLARGSSGELLVGTSRGLIIRRHDREVLLGPADGLVGAPVTAARAEGARIWVGTQAGLFAGGESGFAPVSMPASLRRSHVTALELDARGRLWIGTLDRGAFVGGVTGIVPVEGLSLEGVAVWDLEPAPAGGMWLATNGRGVLGRLDSGSLELTRSVNGLASDFVQQVVADARGRLWIFTNRGLDRWDPDRGVTHFELGTGFADLAGNPGAGAAGPGGRAWFGTPSGLTVLAPAPAASAPVPPTVVIRQVRVDGEVVPLHEPLTVSAARRQIVFAFSALSFQDESGTRFQYRLRGHDDRWSRLTEQREVAYAGLPPGEYVFEVQAIVARGLWSETPATFALRMRPTLWQTIWFRAGVALAVLLAVVAVFRARLRRVEDERQRLRTMVDKRTRELVEKNTLLERMATTDELTALPNRRFFLESMERELRKLSRLPTDQPLSLLVLDLDHFKSINDRYGHVAGDEVLRQVARRLAEVVRATDLPARYGGEEFAILLPNTDPRGARFLAEKLRTEVAGMQLSFEGRRIPVTISVGVATAEGSLRYDPALEEDLLRRADEAMYRAKTGGRDKVVVDGEPDRHEPATGS